MGSQTWHFVLVRALAGCFQDIFEKNFQADKVIERTFKRNRKWGSRDRHFLASTVYDMVRWWNRLAAYDRFGFVPVDSNGYLIRWAYYEAWKNRADASTFLRGKVPDLKIPDLSTLIQNTERTSLKPWEEAAFPQWLYEKFVAEYPDDFSQLLSALNESAPVCLRVNTLKTQREDLQKVLVTEKIETKKSENNPSALILVERSNVFSTRSFKEGLFEVQDEGSQRIAPLLDPKPGERIADVCAGAGGKTLHLAALMRNKGSLLAGDVHGKKLEELKRRARRAGVSNLRVQLFENSKDLKRHREGFDGVLIDAPCTGTGVIRRNPDSKWKLSPEELERLKALQHKVLDDYSLFVRPGGRLVYATCSLLREENEDQIAAFLKRNGSFRQEGKPLVTRPDQGGEDGFFAVKLVRI